MWHDHDIDFDRWLHPAMWHVALESWQWIHHVAAPCTVIRGSGMTCHWIRPAAAPCNVTRSSGIMTLNLLGGSTLQCGRWLWNDMPLNSQKNVRHIGILHLVSISTTSPQSTCHSAPVSNILSNSDHHRQKKSRHDLSHLGFYGSNNRFFEKPHYNLLNCLVFQKITFLDFGIKIQDGESTLSWILGVP